jgi:hypothetical protein
MEGATMTNMSNNDGTLDGIQQGMRMPTTMRTGLTPQAEQQIIRAMDKNKFNTILIVSRHPLYSHLRCLLNQSIRLYQKAQQLKKAGWTEETSTDLQSLMDVLRLVS